MLLTPSKVVQRLCRENRDLSRGDALDTCFQAYDDLWRRYNWPFRRVSGAIEAVGDVTTGTVAVIQGQRTMTFSSAPTQAVVGREVRIDGDQQSYVIKSLVGAVATVSSSYTGDTDAAAAYTVRQMEYKMPVDFDVWGEDSRESGGMGWVDMESQGSFEADFTDFWSEGTTRWVAPSGYTTQSGYSTGTLAIDYNGTTATLTGGTFVEERDWNRRLVLREQPELGWFRIATYTDSTHVVLDRPYRGRQLSGIRFDIDPPGEPLVRLYPQPAVYTQVLFKYYRALPPLQDQDDPCALPAHYHEVWASAAKAMLGMDRSGEFDRRIGELLAREGLSAKSIVRARGIDEQRRRGRSVLPANYPSYRYRGR